MFYVQQSWKCSNLVLEMLQTSQTNRKKKWVQHMVTKFYFKQNKNKTKCQGLVQGEEQKTVELRSYSSWENKGLQL